MSDTDLAAALALTRSITYGHYENFPVASWLMPKNLRQDVCNIYAFARTADDFADEPEFRATRVAELTRWRALLAQTAWRVAHGDAPMPAIVDRVAMDDDAATTPVNTAFASDDENVARRAMPSAPLTLAPHTDRERLIFLALAHTLRTRHLSVQLLDDLLTAYLIDCKKSRYANVGEVLHYCRHSANPVGRLILLLFGYGNETWMQWSDNICTALQLANFWQDVAIDFEKDRIYLPQDDCKKFGVTNEMLCAHDANDHVRALIKFQVERTRGLFANGRALCATVPHRRLQWELKLTWQGGMRILDRIANNDFNPFLRPTLGPRDWCAIVWNVWRWKK